VSRLGDRDEIAGIFRSVNEGIALVAADSDVRGLEDEWEFHCECGACDEWLRMPLARFVAITHEPGGFVLAPDHPVPRARRGRRRSKQLGEHAEAPRAQGEHHQRRAWQQLVPPDAG